MIICNSCRAEQMNGTLFCAECGADLQQPAVPTLGLDVEENSSPVATAAVQESAKSVKPAAIINYSAPPAPARPPSPVKIEGPVRRDLKLVVLNTGRKIDCPDRENVIIGRSDAITGEMPDIDLMPDDAAELGVSRRHACITFRDDAPYLTDLGSTNRTFLNRQVMMRGQPYVLKDGDEIRLGNAIMRVSYKP